MKIDSNLKQKNNDSEIFISQISSRAVDIEMPIKLLNLQLHTTGANILKI